MTKQPGGRDATRTVHDALRRLILEGSLEPGGEVSQVELSQRLSVSRTPLREALRLLEREGLVVSTGPHRLVQISPLSMSDLDDLYSLRVMGEALAIWLTVPILGDEELESLGRELDIQDPEAHRRFHAGLRAGAGERLREQLERLFEHAERYHRAYRRQEDQAVVARKYAEHRAILDACMARDRVAARDLLVDHLSGTAMSLMARERHAPFSLPTAVAMAKGQVQPVAGSDPQLAGAP